MWCVQHSRWQPASLRGGKTRHRLDENPSVPKLLPKTQLWFGLKRWGATGAASVIEARIQELGGEPREESVPDRAARFERSRKFSEHRQQFLNSEPGVNAANAEFEALTSVVQRRVEAIKESASRVSLQVKTARCKLLVLGLRVGLSAEWRYQFRNTLDNAKLYLTFWNTHPLFPGIHHFDEPKNIGSGDLHLRPTVVRRVLLGFGTVMALLP